MSEKDVTVTVDRKQIPDVDELMTEYKGLGLEVDQVTTIFNVTNIFGRFDGDIRCLQRDGVVVETTGWKHEMPHGD